MGLGDLYRWLNEHVIAAVVIEICVLGPVVFAIVWRNYRAWLESANASKNLCQRWTVDQPWRTPTDIGFIENLKRELFAIEEHLSVAKGAAESFLARHEALGSSPPVFAVAWFALVEVCRPHYSISEKDYENGEQLCSQIDRIWAGNAHRDIADLNVRIKKLERRKQDYSSEEKEKSREIDDELTELHRSLDDIQEVVRRAQMSPDERKYHEQHAYDGLMIKDKIHVRLVLPTLSRKEAAKVREEMVQEIKADPHMDDTEKRAALEELTKTCEGLFPTEESTPTNAV